MKTVVLSVTTDTGGDGTTTGDTIHGAGGGAGIWALDYLPGTLDTGATVTVTDETQGASFTIWAKASAGTSNLRIFPRVLETLNSDGSDLATHTNPVFFGKPKVVVSDGGAVKTGKVVLHLMEL